MDSRLIVRMVAPTLLVAALLLLLGGLAAWYVHQLQQESAKLLTTNVQKARAAEELVINTHDLRHELAQYLDLRENSHLNSATEQLNNLGKWITSCQELADSDAERQLVQSIEKGYQRFSGELAAVTDIEKGGASHASVQRVITIDMLKPAMAYRQLIGKEMVASVNRDQLLADRMGIGLLVLGACGAVAGLVAGFGIARSVHRSIVQLSVPVHDAAGRLNEVVGPISLSAETLGDLESTMQLLAERISTVVDRLQQSQAAVRRAEQLASLGQLAAGIAHELRNPLTSMKIIVQTAADQGDNPELDQRDLAILTEEITRLETRIQSFLDYARPPKPVKRPCVARDALAQTIDLIAYRADQMGIRIERQLAEDVVYVRADASQLRELFLNLLINAIEASPEDGIVRVRLSYQPNAAACSAAGDDGGGDGWFRIDVEDDGSGLPADLGGRIFEPFVSGKESGTGLGLPICKRIVEDHGGQITAANRPEGGTVFSVLLPAQEGEAVRE